MHTPLESNGEDVGPGITVHVRLLGENVCRPRGNPAFSLAPKDAALLAKLAFDGPQARTALCALFWPGASFEQAQNSLRQRLFRLNRAAGLRVIEAGENLRLSPHVVVDAAQPAMLSNEALIAAGTLLTDVNLHEYIELQRWLEEARTRWAQACAHVLTDRVRTLEQVGRLHNALQLARRIVELQPLAEHGWRRLMRLHYLRGDQAASRETFFSLQSLLQHEAGTRPDIETLQLMQTIEAAVVARFPPQQAPGSPVQTPLPDAVQALLNARLRALPPSAREVLSVAAVAGPDLSADRASRVLKRPMQELGEAWALLEADGVLRGEAFSHDLMQEAALRSVPVAMRIALHCELAKLLDGDGAAYCSRAAWHWEQAGHWSQAARSWHAAGVAAGKAGHLSEQAELLERAVRLRSHVEADTKPARQHRETVVRVATIPAIPFAAHLLPSWARDRLVSEPIRLRVEVAVGTSLAEAAAHLIEKSCAPFSVPLKGSVPALFADDELALIALFPSGAVRTVGGVRTGADGTLGLAPFSYWDLLDPDDQSDLAEGGSIAQQVDLVAVAIAV